MSKDFDWSDDSVCIPKVMAVSVYINSRSEIVIRQEGDYGEEDNLVIIPREHVSALINKINEVTKELDESFTE